MADSKTYKLVLFAWIAIMVLLFFLGVGQATYGGDAVGGSILVGLSVFGLVGALWAGRHPAGSGKDSG